MRKRVASVVYLVTAIMFLLSSPAIALQGKSIAKGDFSVYKQGHLVEHFTGQNPVDEETLLVCNNKCMVKSPGVALVAKDGTKFAIKNKNDTFNIFFREGLVQFVITNNVRKVAFHTPEGSYTVADVVFQASSQSSVRGYITVNDDGKTEIGVQQGRLVFSTASGTQVVDANHRFVLAISQVVVDEKEKHDVAGAAWAGGTLDKTTLVVGGVVLVGGTAYLISRISDDDETVEVTTLSPSN